MTTVVRAVLCGLTTLLVLGAGLSAAVAGTTTPTVSWVDVEPCAAASAGQARCLAVEHRRLVRSSPGAQPLATSAAAPVGGLSPAGLRTAYGVGSVSAPAGTTVAIVDAYDTPTVEADLAAFRAQYGLPACTTANGCFRKIDQRGAMVPANKSTTSTTAPVYNANWQLETTLDTQAVSAMCPTCRLLLVEADSTTLTSGLGPAVAQAVAQGATIISNSFGSAETSESEQVDTSFWKQPTATIYAATGDAGWSNYQKAPNDPNYGRTNYPAASLQPNVVAVGGTSFAVSRTGTITGEQAWSAAGSGCSIHGARPAYQARYFQAKGIDPDAYQDATFYGCNVAGAGRSPARAVADLSMLADPSHPGLSMVLRGSWTVGGGTSLAAALAAGLHGLAGARGPGSGVGEVAYGLARFGSGSAAALADVTSGTNRPSGFDCDGHPVCVGGTAWDGPTGLGEPRGTGLFASLLSTTSTSAAPGGTVAVTGRNWKPRETVTFGTVLNSAPKTLSTVTVASDGTFSAAVPVLAGATGSYPVTATGAGSAFTATRTVPVADASVSVTPAGSLAPGQTFGATGRGFAAGEQVAFSVAGDVVTTVTAGADGVAATGSAALRVPSDATASVAVGASGRTSGRAVATSVPVTPAALAGPASALPGGPATVTGTGFGAGETVALSLDGAGAGTVTAGADGTWSVSGTTPTTAALSTRVVARGETTARTASLTIALPAATASGPATVPRSTATFAVGGTGFAPGETVDLAINGRVKATAVVQSDGTLPPSTQVSTKNRSAGPFDVVVTGRSTSRVATVTIRAT